MKNVLRWVQRDGRKVAYRSLTPPPLSPSSRYQFLSDGDDKKAGWRRLPFRQRIISENRARRLFDETKWLILKRIGKEDESSFNKYVSSRKSRDDDNAVASRWKPDVFLIHRTHRKVSEFAPKISLFQRFANETPFIEPFVVNAGKLILTRLKRWKRSICARFDVILFYCIFARV